jgi:hypothetical protein
MSDSGFASLGPSLLARKGGAKPAMRPQVAPLVADETEIADERLEDLGWNDMGDHEHASDLGGGADVVPIHGDVAPDMDASGPGPIVRRQQRRLEERVLADAAMTGSDDHEEEYNEEEEDAVYGESFDSAGYDEDEEEEEDQDGVLYAPLAPVAFEQPVAAPAPVAQRAAKTARMPAVQSGRRAAFTLRLDADRHLKLRLAATMQGVSAQVLVTEALDRLLAEYDDLDVIANHLKRH